MKAIEILKLIKEGNFTPYLEDNLNKINEAIEEVEAYITNYQGIKRRLDNAVETLAVLQKENQTLKAENQDLLNTVIEAQKVIKNVLEGRK